MAMVVSPNLFVVMAMGSFVLAMDVGMGVGVFMDVAVGQVPVAVFMAVDMGMHMGVLQGDGVLHHQHRGNRHNSQAPVELNARPLSQQEHTEGHPQEGGNGVVGAGFGGPQVLLGLDVEIDAEPISHKAQQQGGRNPDPGRKSLPRDQGHGQATQAGENTLHRCNLDGGLGAEHPGAVVFQTPAAGGPQDQQRTGLKPEAALPLKAQDDACHRHQDNSQGEPSGHGLREQEVGHEGGGDDLKIIQQRRVRRVGVLQPHHQRNGGGNVQHHHGHGVRQFLLCQRGCLFSLTGDLSVKQQTQTGPQVQKRCHHGGLDPGEQQLGKGDVDGVQ